MVNHSINLATGQPVRGDDVLTGNRWMAACCCALLVGCGMTKPWADQFTTPNPFGLLFHDKREVLEHIPIGTPMDKAEAVMRAHGFQKWSSQSQHGQLTLVFHVYDPARVRAPGQDIWVTLDCKQGAVVDVEVRPGTG